MRIGFAVAVLAMLFASTLTAGSYNGLYRPDSEWAQGWDCKSVGMDGGALAVQGGRFFGVENTCELTNPTEVRDMDATLYDAICTGEGESYSYRPMLIKTPNGIALLQRGGSFASFRRCP